ncbi:aldo/keto reductase [Micrococcus sp. 2A]|uniref:aldo/keto reductase n=1 Tax=unclassified Micrococcus TaxID=2620948 RepID=UPI00200617A1|nr:aldo/keto reductase [uncultured Micrococcus sp.]
MTTDPHAAEPRGPHAAAPDLTAPDLGADVPATVTLTGTGVAGVEMPRIGLGTWRLAGEEGADAVHAALAAGYRHVDTAENYGNEDAVGLAVARALAEGVLTRDELFLTTKFNREHHGGPERVRPAVEASLRRLGVDHADLVLIHWPNPEQDRYVETAAALAGLVETGLIRAWGVSNFTAEHLDRLAEAGLRAPVDQIQVDPVAAIPGWQAAVHAHGAVVTAYSPIGRAELGIETREAITAAVARTGRTVQQVVLRWHLQHGRVVIPKSADPARQAENLDLLSFSLTPAEMAGIDALDDGSGPRQHPETFGH